MGYRRCHSLVVDTEQASPVPDIREQCFCSYVANVHRPTDDEPSDLYLPMTTADPKVQFTHPFRPSPLAIRTSQFVLGSGKLASMCELISPRTIINSGRGSRSPSPTRSGSSSATSSASSSPLGSPRYPCRDPRCCGPPPPVRAGTYFGAGGARGDNSAGVLRYPNGSSAGGGRAEQKQTRRGTGRKGSWRCGLHAVLEHDEECAVGD